MKKPAKAPARKATASVKNPAQKTRAKPVAKSVATKPLKPVLASSAKTNLPKPKTSAKLKLVRDSFTLPEPDHDLIKQCKKTAIAAGRETKKSEVVRAAIRAFSELSSTQQLAAYEKLQSIAVGRPKSK
jgi:hypothetical protein